MAGHYGALAPGLPHGDPEDCGPFCVWWYTQLGRKADEKRWAFARRSACGTYWQTSSPRSGYLSREEAVAAAEAVT